MEKILFKPGSSLTLTLEPIASLGEHINVQTHEEMLLTAKEQTRYVTVQAVHDNGNAVVRDDAIERAINIGVILYGKESEEKVHYMYVWDRNNKEIKCAITSIVLAH